MEEKTKGLLVGAVIIIFLCLLVIIGFLQKEKEKTVVNNNQATSSYKGKYSTDYMDAFEKEKSVLYIGSSSCSVCSKFTPYMQYLSETYDFEYYYMDANTVERDELLAVLEKVDVDISDFGTPYVAFLENGNKVEEIPGYITESSLFTKLQEHKIIGEDKSYVSSSNNTSSSSSDDDSNYTSLTFIDYNRYKELYDSGEKMILVLGQTGCGACKAYKPFINEIAKEKEVPIYYLNINTLKSDDAYQVLDSLSYFDDKETWGTPLTLIVENQDVVDYQEGYNDKDTTLKFFNKNGFAQ